MLGNITELLKCINKKIEYRTIAYVLIYLVYMELILHLAIEKSIDINFLWTIGFLIPISILLNLISRLNKYAVNKLLTISWMMLVTIAYIAQLIYYKVFGVFMVVYSIKKGAGQAMDFTDTIANTIESNIVIIILLILPFFVYIIKGKRIIKLKTIPFNVKVALFILVFISQGIIMLLLSFSNKELYSPYDLYHNTYDMDESVKKIGLLTSMRIDFARLIFEDGATDITNLDLESLDIINNENVKDKDETNNKPTQEETDDNQDDIKTIDTSPNVLDIDFENLMKNEKDENLLKLHEYFSAVTPTNKNEYTGMFKDYNLIFLTAEGFSPYFISEELTPTLYKMTNESFVFNNFYVPIWGVSTSDGEYVATTGLIPKPGVWSFSYTGSNKVYLPFTMGMQFKNSNVTPYAWHNGDYKYYDRHISHPNLGYNYRGGSGGGLNITDIWPESDLEMMELTVDDYINDDRFHAYYMTISGHLNYSFIGNSMSSKNKEAVKDLDLPENCKAYIACNLELEKAMTYLLERLENKGVLDKTLIVLSADHYPYGLVSDISDSGKVGSIDKLAGKNVEDSLDLYKSALLMYNSGMKEKVVIDKYCSSLDIIPTLNNLFGFDYDSRLLMGRDILSTEPGLVIFNDKSFISDKVIWDKKRDKLIYLTDEVVTQDYITAYKKYINNKFLISSAIIENDYYRKVVQN